MGREQRRDQRQRRSWLLPVGIAALLLLVFATQCEHPFRDSAYEKVVKKVEHDNQSEPWMKHVTDWSHWPFGITVTTDYPPDRKASWLATYEICLAVKRAYAKDATEFPRVVVKGTDTRVAIKVDGSRHRHTKSVQLAISWSVHDYVCGITPPKGDLKEAQKLGIPVYLF